MSINNNIFMPLFRLQAFSKFFNAAPVTTNIGAAKSNYYNNNYAYTKWYSGFTPFDVSLYELTLGEAMPGLEATITKYKRSGTRYHYINDEGLPIYVSPQEAKLWGNMQYEGPINLTINGEDITWDEYVLQPKQAQENINGAPSQQLDSLKVGGTPVDKDEKVNWFKSIDWKGLGLGLLRIAPNILEDVRLAGNLYNNERVYKTMLEGIRPNLMLTYLTHRQIVGDEATKLAYYRRGTEGVTRASQAFTSDADRLMAYLMEAQRQANELRAQGDLADNQEIRRTSDESNLHQWANTLRRTEVANLNTAQINAANQAKQNLLALKHSANWSSWENYLYGREARWRQKQQENKALTDLIWQLDRYGLMLEDPLLLDILSRLEAAYKKPENLTLFGTINYNSKEIRALLLELRKRQLELLKETYELQRARNSGIFMAKSGTKVTYKKKDDLLYKTTKDIVEHFRYMTKLTDDSYLKSRKKVPRLTPHPKSTKKYLLGGVAPFTVFRPVAIGGEQSMTTQTSGSSTKSSSTKDDAAKELLNLVKDLFSKINGLPIDVSAVYAPLMSLMERVLAGGPELSTQEISTIYIQSMLQLNLLQYNLKVFEEAKKLATDNESLDDFVIVPGGKILTLNTNDGSFKPLSWKEIEKSDGTYRPLTNNALLELRAHSPNLALNSDILRYVSGTVGISKVTEEIRKLATNIGTTELEKQGFSKKESEKIIRGLKALSDAPSGVYKYTEVSKDLEEQMKAALRYVLLVLPLNMKSTLKVYADINDTTPDDIIANGLSSLMSLTNKIEWLPLTGKAAGNGENDIDKINANPLVAMLRLIGGTPIKYLLITRDSNTRMSVNATSYSAIPKVKEDMSIDKMLSESGFDGMLAEGGKYGITFGDLSLRPEDLPHIMYSNNGGAMVTLPYKIVNGHKQVNLAVVDLYEEAEKEALKTTERGTPEYEKKLGEELSKRNLDSLLKSDGYPNKEMLGEFLVVEAYTTDRVNLNKNSKYIEKVTNPDKALEDRISQALSTDAKKSNYKVDINDWGLGVLFEGGWDDIYKGTVFIPISNNPVAAINSYGDSNLKIGQLKDLEELYQISNKSARYNKNTQLEK